jgi:transposase
MHRRYVRTLTVEEQDELTRMYRTSRDANVVHRCHAVLLSAEGLSVPDTARLLGVNPSAVHRWLDRFEEGGVLGLVTVWSDGRPPRWDEAYEALLIETVRHDPRWYALEQSNWTCKLLAGYLAHLTGITLSAERIRVLLHAHNLRLKQPTAVVHSPDPLYDPKG